MAQCARLAGIWRECWLHAFDVFYLPRREPDVSAVRDMVLERGERDRYGRTRAAKGAVGYLWRTECAWGSASPGPLVFPGRRHARHGRDGHPHLRLLAAAVRGRPIHRRALTDYQWNAPHGDRCDAGGFSLRAQSGADPSSAV